MLILKLRSMKRRHRLSLKVLGLCPAVSAALVSAAPLFNRANDA